MGHSRKSGAEPVKYYATMEQVICMSPADAIVEIEINEEKAWVDPIVENKEFYIDKPELFGGKSSEGGVQGWCEARFGSPEQNKSNYLASKIKDILSATRGVVSLVAKDFYLGNNPYSKPWHFRIKSTLKNADYSDNWYREKATISYYGSVSTESRFRYIKAFANHAFLHATSSRNDNDLICYFSPDKNLTSIGFSEYLNIKKLDAGNSLKTTGEHNVPNAKRDMVAPSWYVPSTEVATVVYPCDMYRKYYDTTLYQYGFTDNYRCDFEKVSDYSFNNNDPWLTSQHYICSNANTFAIRKKGSTYTFEYRLGITEKYTVGGHYGATTVVTSDDGSIGGLSSCDCVFTDGLVAYYSTQSGNKINIYGYTNPNHGSAQNTHGHFVNKPSADTFDCFGCDSEKGVTYILSHDNNDEYHVSIFYSQSGTGIETYTIPDTLPVSDIGESTYFLLTYNYMICVCGDIAVAFARDLEDGSSEYDNSQLDYNPAHAIREAITSKVWGLGKDESVIDDANFRAVADTLYNEKMGISFVFESDDKVSDFIGEVLKVIGGTLRVDRSTGLVQIKLFRADYNPAELLVFDTSNVLEISNVKRTALSECVNQVTCKYKNFKTGEDASIVYQDLALMQAQGEIINADFDYPYVYFPTVADKLAQRDLYETSGQFFSCTIKVGLAGRFLNLGDCIKLNFPHLGIDNLVFRVFKITYGGSSSNEITMEIVQDKFFMPNSTGYVKPVDVEPETPLPSNIEFIKTMELPYYVLYKFGEDIDALLDRTSNTGGKVGVFISSYNTVKLDGAKHYLSVDNGETWTSVGSTDKNDFVASCVLVNNIAQLDNNLIFTKDSDLSKIDNSYVGLIDDEIIGIGEVSVKNNTLSIARGLFDTVPQKHNAGAVIYFFKMNDKNLYNTNDYVAGNYLFKFPYTLDKEVQNLNLCESIETSVSGRAYMPYPPACVKQGGQFFPDLKQFDLYYSTALTWKPRNRLTQLADNFVLWTDNTNITAESGVAYEVAMSNNSGSVRYVYTTTDLSMTTRLPCDIERYVRFTISSYRVDNGVTTYCYQPVVIEGECREASFIFGINNFSQLVLEINTYYPITAETVNDEVILRITDANFATELGVDEDGMLYRLIEV